ncbi:MAG TPA: Ig-like domain-containing protein [Actinomycetota bacterium]|nr:Ig-like domain-containing protein [Actinomycetota bacterium]
MPGRVARVRLSAALVPVLLLTLAGTVQAGTVTLAPPYDSSYAAHSSCTFPYCTSDAAADPATGDLRASLVVTIPPESGSALAIGLARVVAAHTLGAEAGSIDYVVNFHISEAAATAPVCTDLGCGEAEVKLWAYARHASCGKCQGSALERVIATTQSGAPDPAQDLALSFTLTNLDGGPVPQGTIQIVGQLSGRAFASCPLTFGVCNPSRTTADGVATMTNIEATWNSAPVAVDDSASGRAGFPVRINVLANDSDVDGDSLTISGVSDPPNGSAVINADNSVTYDPNGCFVGTDTFSYSISDGNGGGDTALVSVQLRKTSRRSSIGC